MKDIIVIAKKEHLCECCSKKIDRGERYHNIVILPSEDYENGEFNNYKIHLGCYILYILMRQYDVGSASEGLIESDEWEEHLDRLLEKIMKLTMKD